MCLFLIHSASTHLLHIPQLCSWRHGANAEKRHNQVRKMQMFISGSNIQIEMKTPHHLLPFFVFFSTKTTLLNDLPLQPHKFSSQLSLFKKSGDMMADWYIKMNTFVLVSTQLKEICNNRQTDRQADRQTKNDIKSYSDMIFHPV